ncbi:MAG: hypothetical protein JWP89_3091 [Schlesneria sp.]|nr:hypothetical protein [Schlesneria sp.]
MAILLESDEVKLIAGRGFEYGAHARRRGQGTDISPAQKTTGVGSRLIALPMPCCQDIAEAAVVVCFPCVGWPSGIFELSGQRWEFLPLACSMTHTKEI